MEKKFPVSRAVPSLAGRMPLQCHNDLDSLQGFVHSTIAEESPAAPVSANDFQEVLLTGATGFVGRFLLRELLRQNDNLVVNCLVRADDVEHGFARTRAALEHADIWEDALGSRIRVTVGDICAARFGLGEAEFEDLRRRIDAVYHLAADLSLTSSYSSIRAVNSSSLRNVLALCLRTRFKHVFYASTMGVFPEYFCNFSNEFSGRRIEHHMQPDLAAMKRLFPPGFVGYPWSKLVSEQALLFANAAGLPVAIFRLPQTGMSSTGYTQASAISVRTYNAAIQIEMAPAGFSIQSYAEPVDTLAELCAAISLNPERRFTIYHCCDAHPPHDDFGPADFGLYLREVPYESFKRASQALGERSPLYGLWDLVDFFAPSWFAGGEARGVAPVDDRAIREDCPFAVRWPALLLRHSRSYDWIRRQREGWPYPVPKVRLDFDRLMTQAEGYAERDCVPFDFAYPGWMRAGVQHLVEALNARQAGLLEERRPHVVYELNRQLRNNAALAREWQQHPEIEREEIVRPVFIVGINRTGTTFLHRMMARDRRFWTLRRYELAEPVLASGEYGTVAWTDGDPRRAHVKEVLDSIRVVEQFAEMHHIDVDQPEEDFPILRQSFASWVNAVAYYVPGYRNWLAATGSGNAYAYHHRVMRHFTWQRRQRKRDATKVWLFKMPFHLMELEALLANYPDAIFIQTHRDPAQFVGSWNSLVDRIRSVSLEPRPPHETGAEQLDLMSGMLNEAMRFRKSRPEIESRWVDVSYRDLVENPMAVVQAIYERLEWRLEPVAYAEMEGWLERQAEQRRQEPPHRYCLEDFGLTAERVAAAFAPYREFVASRKNV
ncbi:MAG: SDR family oxidoreductase [Boseongicola sp.]|nr:SDR family oxidoreductase [Boseongicola sp.]